MTMTQDIALRMPLLGGIGDPGDMPVQDGEGQAVGQPHPGVIPANLAPPNVAQANGQQLIPQQNIHQLAGHVVPGPEGFWQKAGRWLSEVFKRNAGLPDQLPIRMPNGGVVNFPGNSLACMIKALPRLDRAAARANLIPTLEARLAHGGQLLDVIRQGPPPAQPNGMPPCSVQDAADLMLYLDASCRVGGHGFAQGAYCVEDPAGHLSTFLNSCTEKYQRSSSHLNDTQHIQVDNHRNTHRGIDLPPGPNGLPHDNATLLFGVLPGTGNTPRRLFLKAETHGCRLSTLSSQAQREGLGDVPDRPWRVADIGNIFKHGFSFLTTRGQGDAAGTRKERIPGNVQNAYKALQRHVQDDPALSQILSQNNPFAKSHGVHVMLNNMRQALESLPAGAPQRQALVDEIAPFRQALSQLTQVDHLDERIGNESIQDMAALLNPVAAPPMTEAQKLADIDQALGL